ncbi:DUF5686 family protein [Hoylesella enoeca]|uniref:DUF5686 family protein n=1 Tax=Hoylesella enoeca TaxID=76123 RepID=UPI00288A8867|nr:DUF5686 family protein [Hoylesella enoeca]
MSIQCKRIFGITLVALIWVIGMAAKIRPDTLMIRRIYNYPQTVDTTGLYHSYTYSYRRHTIHVRKRNFTLLAVPSMYFIAHGDNRKYISEAYDKITFNGQRQFNTQRMITLTTIPHHRKTMPTLLKYLTPQIYNETIIENHLLSPFNRHNHVFYRYKVTFLLNGTARVSFKPRQNNTQLIRGTALVDYATGRVNEMTFSGEYDMINFSLHLIMGETERKSLLPEKCELSCNFKFIGNLTEAKYIAYYGLPKILPDSIVDSDDIALMKQVRPDTLDHEEQTIYDRYYEMAARKSATPVVEKKKNKLKTIFWDIIGDHLVNRIKSNFGDKDQGYIRINPIANPLYMGYSHRRGITYKFNIRSSYNFSDNSELWGVFKAGYSFKQHQFYMRVPMIYYYNKHHNGFLQLEFNNGDRINNTSVSDHIEDNDRTRDYKPHLNTFKDMSLRVVNNYDISDKFGFQIGFILHRRTALNKAAFEQAGLTFRYRSFAPVVELEYRPFGWKGPILTLDYERSIRGSRQENTAYERWEIDGQYIRNMSRLQCLSLRLGTGFYTWKDHNSCFLDFANFRENNIPGGWNDEWSGEFELLSSKWYNESKYYVRANATYESPLLITSRLPWVGHFIETERIYVSALSVKQLHPYFELGYGFTTRLFSVGMFVANRNGKFSGFGCRFGLELFRHW